MQMTTNLIDTYVSEVGRRLPSKTRADIQAEIRSILQDMLEERSRKTGNTVDEEMTLEILKEYGAPEKVASTYQGERYLVGPRLYPIFMLVLRIVLIVIGVLAAIGLGIALSGTIGNPHNAFETILKAVANFGTTTMTALGNIVLIFGILEWALFRAGAKVELKGFPKDKEWDPRSLTRLSTPNQVKMGETIAEIVGCFAAIVIFNFYPQIIGFTPSLNSLVGSGNLATGLSGVAFTPLLSEAFFYFVPYLTLVWALTIILDIVLLRMGYWTVVTRICLIGLKIVSIVIAAGMLGVPSLLAITTASLTAAIGDAGAASTLMTMLSQFIRVALWLGIIGSAIEIIRAASRLATHNILPQVTGNSL
jgi:HAAS